MIEAYIWNNLYGCGKEVRTPFSYGDYEEWRKQFHGNSLLEIKKVNTPLAILNKHLVNKVLNVKDGFFELIFLDQRMEGMTEKEKDIFSGMLELFSPVCMQDIVNLSCNMDKFMLYQGVYNERELGEYLLNYGKITDKTETDLEILGHQYAENHTGIFMAMGYVLWNGQEIGQVYNGTDSFDVRKCFTTIWQAAGRLAGTVIENKDFEALIRQYDRENAFFYCDPPYYETEKYYTVAFKEDDHKRLKAALADIKGKWMLSYNDCEFIRELYAEYYITAVTRLNNKAQRYVAGSEFSEVIITNYDPKERERSKPQQLDLEFILKKKS
ncbi:DNA adenine methylase [Clostridium sp.]